MDYLGCLIPEGSGFVVQDDDELWVRADYVESFSDSRCVFISLNGLYEHWMSYDEGYQSLSLPEPGNYQFPDVFNKDVQVRWRLHRPGVYGRHNAQEPQISTWGVVRDPDYQEKLTTQIRASYDVLGTCSLKGSQPKDIGPLHLPRLRGGRIALQINDAVRTNHPDEYGTIVVQTSEDGSTWRDLANSGFAGGPLMINQQDLRTGDIIHDELYLADHGPYIRLQYRPTRIAGWGFNATLQIETKR